MAKATLLALTGSMLATMALVASAGAEDRDIETRSIEYRGINAYRLLQIGRQSAKWYGAENEAPLELTYAYVDRRMSFTSARNCGSMQPIRAVLNGSDIAPEVFRREAKHAFAIWETVAQIRFVETGDVTKAQILIGAQTQPLGRAFTNVEIDDRNPRDGPQAIARSLICFNPTVRWKVGYDGDLDVYDLRYTMAHEIGHALGLDHPGASGQLMAYRYDERHQTLQPGDIDGILKLYRPTRHAARIRLRAEQEASRQAGLRNAGTGNATHGPSTGSLGLGDGRARE
ncbi:MAG: matrixin family metalloprotease [Alphaproteobacteria bacterium]|nr:matrixin family metalloprotease [Alphaproteobacteria bacterium]